MQSDGDLFSLHRFVGLSREQRLSLLEEGLRLGIVGPLGTLHRLPQAVQVIPRLIRLPEAIMCHRQEGQVGRETAF